MSRLRDGSSLVGTLVALFVLIGVVAFYFTGGFGKKDPENARPDGKGNTLVGRAMLKADDTACQAKLSQVRIGISAAWDHDDDVGPFDLSALRLGDSYTKCPIGSEPYDYDPSTGEVSCPHLGHEDY